MRLEDVTLSKAHTEWKRSATFNEKVYNIMQMIVKRCDVKCLINRNPTLNYYSMLLMNVREVKKDGGDFALSVPLSILSGLNADSTNIKSGSDRVVTSYEYVCERLTSGVSNYKIAC